MGCAICKIVGNLEIYRNGVMMEGVVSAALNASTDIFKTPDGLILVGPTTGTLNISAYPYVALGGKPRGDIPYGDRMLGGQCRGRAGTQVEWVRRYDCDTNKLYFIPKKGGKAYIEGEFSNTILYLEEEILSYNTFNADASQGPHTSYLLSNHIDGYNLIYTGGPISFESTNPMNLGQITIKERSAGGTEFVMPEETEFYLSSFELSIEPPFTSRVSYTFIFYFRNPEGFTC